ncbi:hypothetical protein FJZ27_04060 [Candidatus Peribacteria bacterium]|nr:hypothetical protein [Candidatus Peribacteria bacterium]
MGSHTISHHPETRPPFPTLHFDTTKMTETARTQMRDWIFANFQSPVIFDAWTKSFDVTINEKSWGCVPDIRRMMQDLGALEVVNDK